MVKQEYNANHKKSKSVPHSGFNSATVNEAMFDGHQLKEQRPLQPPKPLASSVAGNTFSPFPLTPPEAFGSSHLEGGISLQEMQALFNTMQAQLTGLMHQLTPYGLLATPFAPINPLAELQQNYHNLLIQFNQFVVSQSQVNAVPSVNSLTNGNFSLMDGFAEFIARFEKLVEKGYRSDGTLRQWKSTKGKIKKFLEDKYRISDILYVDVMPDFGGGASVSMGANLITSSTAPVATGTSFRIPAVNSAGAYAFTGTGLELGFGTKAPSGELVVSRLNTLPDSLPSAGNFYDKYWIVRNYGANQTFDPLTNMVFSGMKGVNTSGIRLYRRGSNEALNNWTGLCQSTAPAAGSAAFGSSCGITGFSQFLLGGLSALPLRLIRFEATAPAPRQALVKWHVSEDNEPASYALERSENGVEWKETIHRAVSESGTKREYPYTDKQAKTGWNYYRLRLTGKDNEPFYSPVKSVFVKESEVQFKVFPVPVAKNQPLELESNLAVPVSYTLYDPAGRELRKGEFTGKGALNMSGFAPGVYVILISSKEYMEFKKIIVP